jgi:SpoVK/Ycf46/Vps4 family AAA+-type ATPase
MDWIEEFVLKRKSQKTNCFLMETEDPKRVSHFEQIAKNGKFKDWLFAGKTDFDRILGFDIQRGKTYDLKTDAELPRDPMKSLMDEFDSYLQSQRTLIIVKYVTLNRHAETLTDWLTACAYDDQIFEKRSTIVVFTSNARLFSDTTRRFVHTITVYPSTPEERGTLLRNIAEGIKTEVKATFDRKIALNVSDELIQSSAGLTLHDIETAALESFHAHRKFAVEPFSDYKIGLLKEKDVRYVMPERGFESVGGYDYLKQYIRNNIIKVLRNPDIAHHYGLRIPRGIILYGTPGCGKTFLAKALAKEVGLAMIEVSSATFMRGIVGETEARVTQLTALIESLAPIIVFIDEIDEIALKRDQALITDSIPSYSPIMVRRVDNSIDILSLEDLFLEISHKPHTETTTENGEQILKPLEPYWVRTTPNAGRWTKLRYILRHFYEGPLVRILAGGGLVEVTPNHSVYTAKSHLGQHDNHLRNPRTIKAGEELAILSCDIPKTKPADLFFYGGEDLAWLYGFFVAEGSAYIHHKNNFQVSFSNNNEQLLEKASKIMEHYFGKERPIISEQRKDRNDPTLKYVWNGRSLFKWFRQRFYSSNLKRVPAEILTAPKKIQQAFIEGYLDGDGTQRGIQRCDTNSMILAEGLRYILNLLGQKVRLQTRHDKQNIITLNFVQGTGHALIPVCKVKSTSEKHYTGYVYDIETESHRFYTGVGPVLVHNSGVRRSMQNLLMKWLGDEKRQSFIVGATNLLESCDPAFYRAGRIDEAILVLPPDLEARTEILQKHTSVLRKVPLDKDVNLRTIAEKTFLFTGGELEKLVLDASRTAMKEESNTVKQEHFDKVLEGTKINVKTRQERIQQMVSTMQALQIVNQAFLNEALKLFAKAEKDTGRLKGFLEFA